jgi:serine phosphatase RsbU (regulator of sigma subunit)/anti-sigma regulatory factor (Ser/Thr protein kinase)
MRTWAPISRADLKRLIVLAVAYYATAYVSLKLSLVGSSVTPFWPPTGIAVFAFITLGPRFWPAVAIAAFAVNATIGGPLWAAALIAVGNTLAPLVAWRLLKSLGFRDTLATLRDTLSIVAAALIGTLVSATIGSSALLASGAIHAQAYVPAWSVWWAGDAMGILVVAPVLIVLRSAHPVRVTWATAAELVGEFSLLVAASALMFATDRPVWVLVFPLLALIAWRHHLPAAAPAAFIVSTMAILAAVANAGPFEGDELLGRMLGLHSMNAAVALTSLFLAAVVTERMRVRDALERAAVDLELVAQRRSAIVETFQRSMLPQSLPEIADVELAAKYIPASDEVEVGGDWYDAVALPGGRLVIAIGDVAGQGTQAAATMAQLRMAARAYALGGRSPAEALEQLNAVARGMGDLMATMIYLVLDADSGEYTFASAGHLPPLHIASGESRFVDGGLSAPIGAAAFVGYREASGTLEPGAVLLLYTDGLVERRGHIIDEGLRTLAEQTAAAAPNDLDGLCEDLVHGGGPPTDDDVAVVAIRRRVMAGHRLQLRLHGTPDAVADVRRIVRRWLSENAVEREAIDDALLACSEACTNVVQHAYGAGGGPFTVEGSIDDGELTLCVRDEGRWRTHGDDLGGGRGVTLMRAVMDAVDVVGEEGGTEIRMRRTLAREPAHG